MKRFDVICIGVALIDLPIGPVDEKVFKNETTMVPELRLTTGGDALNEAIILARLGKRPALIGHVGKDMLGDVIAVRCSEEGVDHTLLIRDPNAATRINVVAVGMDGQRHFIKTQSAVSVSFRPDEIDEAVFRDARAVSLASIFCSKLRNPETILKIVKAAKGNDMVTFADVVPMTCGETLGDIAEALPFIDYFLPNCEEAALLTGASDPDEMAELLIGTGIGTVVIKLGKDGCLIRNSEERYRIPAFPVHVIDTTGAGDNFAAGFITAVLEGRDLYSCGVFASAVAALSTTGTGASAGVRDRQHAEAFLLENRKGNGCRDEK
jgi:sugar/nucleoside kinase (ribokinase family)